MRPCWGKPFSAPTQISCCFCAYRTCVAVRYGQCLPRWSWHHSSWLLLLPLLLPLTSPYLGSWLRLRLCVVFLTRTNSDVQVGLH